MNFKSMLKTSTSTLALAFTLVGTLALNEANAIVAQELKRTTRTYTFNYCGKSLNRCVDLECQRVQETQVFYGGQYAGTVKKVLKRWLVYSKNPMCPPIRPRR